MNTKTYQAESMAEALAEVKKDLGRDAVILQTRSFRKGGLLGLFGGKSMWEVTAAANLGVPRRVPTPATISTPGKAAAAAPAPAPARRRMEPIIEAASSALATLDSPDAGSVGERPSVAHEALRKQVMEIRGMVETLLSRQGAARVTDIPAQLTELHQHLLRRDVDPLVSADLLRQLRARVDDGELAEASLLRRKLMELIAEQLPTAASTTAPAAEGKPRVIAMIGPTGVGKTTTIAKMAASFKLHEGRRVGLITVDTYRIAAVDQLRTYAEIIEVPLRAVLTAGELHQALHSMSDLDVILIDTAGRSQNDQMRLSQLRGFLGAAKADEVHLVISATSNPACVRTTLDRFGPLGANRIIISKVDEAETFGMILTVARAKIAMSYVTTGQDVPDDITTADARRLAQWIVGDGKDDNG